MLKSNVIRKWIISSAFTLMLVLFVIPVGKVSASEIIPNSDAGIPDKVLYQEILSALGKDADETFTKSEAASLRVLYTWSYPECKIKTLKGIEHLANLLLLEIYDNELMSLEGVEKLTNLDTLRIGNGQLKNVNEILLLPNLKELSVTGNQLEDWIKISELTGLTKLNLTDCGLIGDDLKQIVSKMTELTSLSISGNNVVSLDAFAGLTKLEELNAKNCSLKSLSGIENFSMLKYLDVSENNLEKLNGIENLIELHSLDASNNKLTSIPNLKKLEVLSMEYTWFFSNKISEKSFKKNLPSNFKKWWINNQMIFQNFKKKLKVARAKKIKSTTTKITGITEKNAIVVLRTIKGKKIKTVKVNKKGVFTFDNLDLVKYKGKKLKITAYLKYDDKINGESRKYAVKTVKFKVRKK